MTNFNPQLQPAGTEVQTRSETDRPADRAAIQELLDGMGEAWLRGDADAYAALLTEDADYVVFDGTRLRGRAENAAAHRVLFQTILRGSRIAGEVENIAFVGADAAIVHSVGAVLWPWQREASPGARSRQTLVVVREGVRWRARAFQNTRLRPMPPLRPGSLPVRLMMAWIAVRTWLAGGRPCDTQARAAGGSV